MQSTLAIFRYLASNVPPLVPATLIDTMRQALEHFSTHPDATLAQLERVMISYGFELWPYNQAFKEILRSAEAKMGEKFLLPKLSARVAESYQEFKEQGGTIESLKNAASASCFTTSERVALCAAVVEVQKNLRDFATQHALGAERKHYLKQVEHFKTQLKAIEKHLNALHLLADREDEHPSLANEIRQHITAFEESLCLLGPEMSYDELCEAVDYFKGRKHHFTHFKQLYRPQTFSYQRP